MPADVIAAVRRDGAAIVERRLAAPAVAVLHAELAPYVAATRAGRDGFSGTRTTRTGALAARSAGTRALILDPLVRACADAFLLPFCERWQLHLTQLIRIQPGQGTQPIHRDRWAWGTHLGHVEPQLNTIWAATEFTESNGATVVVPGSLGWPDDRRPEAHEGRRATMPAGSVLIYTGGVFHGGGANTGDTDRWGLNLTYALGWLRQEENQYLACPPEIAATLPPELAAALGYAMGSYALGYYSPPLPPGEGPELVPPDHALGRFSDGGSLGATALLAAISSQVARP